jgi:hypothetical protein
LSTWINADSLAAANATYGMGFLRWTTGENVGDFFLSVDNLGRVNFANWRSAGNDLTGRHRTAAGTITEDTWYHVAATWDGATNRIYVNSVLTAFANVSTDTGWLVEGSIGREFAAASYFFNGLIDDVGIWSNTLTQDQIDAIYLGGLNGVDLQNALVVPEPSTFALLGLAAAGGVAARRRRRRAARE